MKLIVGLGNPGEKYAYTRHNAGFLVVEKVARELASGQPNWKRYAAGNADAARVGDVVLAKPVSFMNASGVAVVRLASYYKIPTDDIWIVHDDMDLPLGKIRIRVKGSSAGHHGIESVMRELKTDKFIRFRLGIGKGMEARGDIQDKNLHRRFVIDFVLSKFSHREVGQLKHLVKYGSEAIQIGLKEGIDTAMNRFN